jgi:hypothetical protein
MSAMQSNPELIFTRFTLKPHTFQFNASKWDTVLANLVGLTKFNSIVENFSGVTD